MLLRNHTSIYHQWCGFVLCHPIRSARSPYRRKHPYRFHGLSAFDRQGAVKGIPIGKAVIFSYPIFRMYLLQKQPYYRLLVRPNPILHHFLLRSRLKSRGLFGKVIFKNEIDRFDMRRSWGFLVNYCIARYNSIDYTNLILRKQLSFLSDELLIFEKQTADRKRSTESRSKQKNGTET